MLVRSGPKTCPPSILINSAIRQIYAGRRHLCVLSRGSEQDLVHVHFVRLAHREGHRTCERFGRESNFIGKFSP
jgi:hypothetical protein